MVIFRELLSPVAQQWLVDLFFRLGDSSLRGGFGCFEQGPHGRRLLNYGHRAQYVDELAEFPAAFRQLHESIQARVRDCKHCGDAPASVAILNYYCGRSSGMGWHVDADTEPPHATPEEAHGSAVVSLSIGDSCHFRYRDSGARSATERSVRLNSGDVLVFGGPSRKVEHCVSDLDVSGRPQWLSMPSGRINVTFRMW
ncbi:unnamed protein product [Polarella glacialis]|uniref:Fe2OG dioxygenase domain-containing protein n=1 Tax=Polarella glacialis TaxID=89957 RepID=A0A813ESQ7_POLGL|nr:unnamed protein product [Polarella glacialis]